MKFEFNVNGQINTRKWNEITKKLEKDLYELTTTTISEEEVSAYLLDLIQALKPVENDCSDGMVFLMYDTPSSMPADARVEYVYKPTYIAATIMMTAMNRFENTYANDTFQNALHNVLNATMGRNFLGAGHDSYSGLIDTLQIFAQGDVLSFIEKHADLNVRFSTKLEEAIAFLETEICTGKVMDAWSGLDYSDRGTKVLEMLQNRKSSETEYVWYACYGSNINRARFMRYINNCTDTTPPVEDRPFIFNHNIYFAKSAATWHNGGKAFLDDTCEGSAYGRIYKITRMQYEQIKCQEGSDYTKKLILGEIDGIPVYSFTDTQKNEAVRTPSDDYFHTILEGLNECYNGFNDEIDTTQYLINAIFSANVFSVAKAVRENDHYLSNTEISIRTGLDTSDMRSAVSWLVDHGVLKQDRRSIRAGHNIDDPDAFFYTVDNHCGRMLVEAMINALADVSDSSEVDTLTKGEYEGSRRFVSASRIERSVRNRIEAIRLHGYKCQVCGFDYVETYGNLGRNYIEVHHMYPLAQQSEAHTVNPETDLACLCANCHRMIHRNRNHVLSIDELKAILRN